MNTDRRTFLTLGVGALAVAALPASLRRTVPLVRRRIPVMGKFSTARRVWMPYRASTGTWRSPSRSCSVRVDPALYTWSQPARLATVYCSRLTITRVTSANSRMAARASGTGPRSSYGTAMPSSIRSTGISSRIG